MHGIFRKVALLEISRGPLLFAGWYTVCNATKNELPAKFLEDGLKRTENFQEVISNGMPYQEFIDLQTAEFSIACF